ncbi:MAG: hypothetical protein K6G34_01250 [Lachnospiraceae bacterium]|nr:hypothetical protein [Lachnospiraceae bacterium]
MQKKLIAAIIAILVVVTAVLVFINRKGDKNVSGLVLASGGKEITVAWEDVGGQSFEGDLVNGKGEVTHHEYTGSELQALLAANGIEITESSVITAASEDNYSAELTGAELLEAGKVYVALTDGGKQIEGIDGGQGAQLIVFGDQNSKRAVRYLKTISVK